MRVAILADFPLHVIPEFGERFRHQGHYATWLPQLAEAFEDCSDLDAHWVVLSARITEPLDICWKNQAFHVLPSKPKGRASTFFAADRKAIRACLAEIQPDLVHGWGNEDVYGLAAATSGIKNIVSVQGLFSHYILKNRMAPRDYFQALLELYVLRKAQTLTVESAWTRDLVRRRAPRSTQVHLVEYGVPDVFMNTPWEPDPEIPAAIFLGSATPRKGIQDAVAAFRDPALAHAQLWIAGGCSSPWAQQLRSSAGPNVKWFGRVPLEETVPLLSRAWCLVIPTRADTGPTVVKEARCVGLPVVGTRCGGLTTYIQPGENGFYADPGDVKTLTKNLAALLTDLNKCREMGAHLHEEHRQILRPKKTATDFYELYRKALAA